MTIALRLLYGRGYSVNKLARAHGLDPTHLHNALRGLSTPRHEEVVALTAALDVPVSELLDERAIERTYGSRA